ncbi:Chloramphenicol acetyltransferase-like domain containing protein, partial [Trema orientale]
SRGAGGEARRRPTELRRAKVRHDSFIFRALVFLCLAVVHGEDGRWGVVGGLWFAWAGEGGGAVACSNGRDFSLSLPRDLVCENGERATGREWGCCGCESVWERVQELESHGALEGAGNWMRKWKEIVEKYHFVTVAGSQKLGIYETDFGLRVPKKSELVHTDVLGAISLSDKRDGARDGVEFSLALPRTLIISMPSWKKIRK